MDLKAGISPVRNDVSSKIQFCMNECRDVACNVPTIMGKSNNKKPGKIIPVLLLPKKQTKDFRILSEYSLHHRELPCHKSFHQREQPVQVRMHQRI